MSIQRKIENIRCLLLFKIKRQDIIQFDFTFRILLFRKFLLSTIHYHTVFTRIERRYFLEKKTGQNIFLVDAKYDKSCFFLYICLSNENKK